MDFMTRFTLHGLKENPIRTLWLLGGIAFPAAILTTAYSFAYKSGAVLRYNEDKAYYIDAATGFYSTLTVMNWTILLLTLFVVILTLVTMFVAFRMSFSERIDRFDILRNVGVTKRQIWRAIAVETTVLFILGILLGSAAGKAIVNLGIQQLNAFLQYLETTVDYDFWIPLGISWPALVLLILVLSFPVFASSRLAFADAEMRTLSNIERRKRYEGQQVLRIACHRWGPHYKE